jgi:hypothetical protein
MNQFPPRVSRCFDKKIKHLTSYIIIFLVSFVSCTNKQTVFEQKVLAQLGDSCVIIVKNYLKTEFKQNLYPPPYPTALSDLLRDTSKARIELNKVDTLGYPLRFSVIDVASKTDTVSLEHYYREFKRQNEIRIRYVYENITINDTFQTPTWAIINKVLRPTETTTLKYNLNKSKNSITPTRFWNKTKGLCWSSQELKRNDKIIKDLRPTKIKFFRTLFNKDFTEGILLINVDVHGVSNGYGYFEIENIDSKWDIKTFTWFSGVRNKKRWSIHSD